ncbi:lycopene cyclase domain-containing protein [Nocardioides jishulii]|uniref:Lycopene cyclase domain-containing protein n=1 Tax=Nocardioides jishulii TaxID=2575440 RepID=A0A4U2YPS3_9ACTN|nr:lycopene cyclase domain-containing protein [Nocardioides jishulii]QCX27858.1 lycopene cyclase domain-containing protein [Nocardioides jishulii]TKI62665.1 lycopene cyclase domain-containing protein [Nocardioides jishulii]
MSWLYLASIVVSMVCMGLVDRRWRLFLFDRPRVAIIAVVVGFVLFLAWDLVAIEIAVYSKGASPAMSGVDVAPHLPLEELFFITFLCYITGVLHGLFTRVLTHRDTDREASR